VGGYDGRIEGGMRVWIGAGVDVRVCVGVESGLGYGSAWV